MPLFKPLGQFQRIVNPDGTPTREFYRFIENLFIAAGGGGPLLTITLTGSPFVYVSPIMAYIVVQGGTVSKLEFSRDTGTTWIDLGTVAGMFTLEAQDEMRVTYTVAPTMTSVPA